MKIINIVEIVNGVLDNIESFPIIEEQLSREIIDQAEDMFSEKAMQHGAKTKEIAKFIEDGSFDNENGYEVLIHWSAINTLE